MKKLIYILSATLIWTACTDLDTVNRRALSEEQIFEDASSFENILFAAYESVNDFGYYGQQFMLSPDALADNLTLVQFTGRYEGEIVNEQRAHIELWENAFDNNAGAELGGLYTSINECNIVINEINREGVTGDEDFKNQLIGEALFLKSLFYHDLARTYGYEPGQEVDGFSASIVLRNEATLGLSQATDEPRATNVEVYTQIEADLLQAIDLLGASPSENASRASQAAAEALLSRVYLYWGRWADAVTYAERAMANPTSTATLTAAADHVASWNDAAFPFHPESFFESEIRIPDWSSVDGPNNSLHSMLMDNTSGSQAIFAASDEFIAQLQSNPSDVRNNLWIENALGYECQKWQGAKGGLPFLENLPIIRYAEVLLIAAEAKARNGNAAGAQTDIQTLRVARGVTGAVTATGQDLINLIMSERRKELITEGHRFFDFKRLGQDIPKAASAASNSVPYTDFRVLSFIPQLEIELSDGVLVQNPGYN